MSSELQRDIDVMDSLVRQLNGWGLSSEESCAWQRIRASLTPAREAAAAVPETEAKYAELLYAVESKWPGESRHETALRYIRERETGTLSTGPQSAMLAAAERKPDRIWQDRNGALRTSPADCQSFGADGWPIAVYYGSQRFPISQHPLTERKGVES